jgi:hypothetical protein
MNQPVVDLDQGCTGPRWEAAPSGHASWSQRSSSRLLTAVIVEQRDVAPFQSRSAYSLRRYPPAERSRAERWMASVGGRPRACRRTRRMRQQPRPCPLYQVLRADAPAPRGTARLDRCASGTCGVAPGAGPFRAPCVPLASDGHPFVRASQRSSSDPQAVGATLLSVPMPPHQRAVRIRKGEPVR